MRDLERDKYLDGLIREAGIPLSEEIDILLKDKLDEIKDPVEKQKVISIINEHKEKWKKRETELEVELHIQSRNLKESLEIEKQEQEKNLMKFKSAITIIGILLLAIYTYIKWNQNV